jgi:hydroxymethylpyrimidine/phosphomethylpyrimidine kinase
VTPAAKPRLLIVAGHDPSGGAGIDADLASTRDLDVEPLAIVTAFTDQDAQSVRAIGARDPKTWLDEALPLAVRGVAAVKFGLLPGESHVRAAAHLARVLRESSHAPVPIIVDPVIASSSGAVFMDELAVCALLGELVPLGIVLTPNLAEAAQLADFALADLVRDPELRREAADKLLARGASAVIVKGGHGVEDPTRDLIAIAGRAAVWHVHSRIRGGKIRGSGCRYATRLAAALALGRSLEEGAHEAGSYVERLIREQARR